MKKQSIQNILLGVVVLVLAGNTLVMARFTSRFSAAMSDAIEMNRPATLSAVLINAPDCGPCFNIDETFNSIKKTNVYVEQETTLKASDKDAQELIDKYAILRLPTIVLTGEIRKTPQLEEAWGKIGEIRNDAVVLTRIQAPYFSVPDNRIEGQVTVTYIKDDDCAQCADYRNYVTQLKQKGMNVLTEKDYDFLHPEAQELINRYGISRIPTFILNAEAGVYPELIAEWPKIGTVTEDGSYLATPLTAPYRDMTDNKVKGVVSVVSLTDTSCTACLNASELKQLLNPYRVAFGTDEILDINSAKGKALIEKYQIKSVPTLIMDAELSEYASLTNVWKQVGTQETDGNFIFRNLNILKGKTYKDLTTGTLITNN